MDLTTGQQRLLFVVIVIVLAVLGIFLVSSHNAGGGSPAAGGTPTASPSTSAQATGSAYVPPATLPAVTPAATVGEGAIYQWLPFTAADLTAAAQTTTAFAKAYSTWSYNENTAAYGATLSGLVTATEKTTLEASYSTVAQRVLNKQVSTGSGAIDSIQTITASPVSITFLVTINQQVTSTQPTTTTNSQYTVTLVPGGAAWLVNDIELSGLGNR
jgi:hypothetical protein